MKQFDIIVAGGGINGCGIARDAALRGLRVLLCERGDLACATSSASSKLIHGGLRYLEQYEFRLVREALRERELLLRMAPHVIWPLRFVLPHLPGMRPALLIRAGLLLYDSLAHRDLLPGTASYALADDPAGAPLAIDGTAFEYSDCWVDDARLVVLNAVDARKAGAEIRPRTSLESASAAAGGWQVRLAGAVPGTVKAKVVVNAAGPWASELRARLAGAGRGGSTRQVQGSHIVVPRLFDHDKAYILQNDDRRIVFAIPYAGRFTLVGTTDREFAGDPAAVSITDAEIDYLLRVANRYFRAQTERADIVWSYSGVRGLYDDGASDARKVTRDYVIKQDEQPAPMVSIFGGKLTTYRKLSQAVVDACGRWLPEAGQCATASRPLPGGDFPVAGFAELVDKIKARCADLPADTATRLARAYGTLAFEFVGDKSSFADQGEHFGAGLTAAEVAYLMDSEWASDVDDVLWRRTKLGLELDEQAQRRLAGWMAERQAAEPEAAQT